MLQTIIAWLNGTREFYTGVAIYKIVGTDEKLKALFARGYSLYSNYRLQEELKAICDRKKREMVKQVNMSVRVNNKASALLDELKEKVSIQITDPVEFEIGAKPDDSLSEIYTGNITYVNIANPELYEACRNEALKVYKETMNKRALLFNMVPENKYEDANRPDLVASREQLCLDILKGSIEYSELFDKADYVKQHGKLPDASESDNKDIEALADHEVKPALDNARKAYNKLKGREQTAERVALMQKHQDKIKALEERWLCLKQAK